MGIIATITDKRNWAQRWLHKLISCPTWWKSWFKDGKRCPGCGKRIRCYWDGNDIEGVGIDYCNRCTAIIEKPALDTDSAKE